MLKEQVVSDQILISSARLLIPVLLIFSITGCHFQPEQPFPTPNDPQFAPVYVTQNSGAAQATGSIYRSGRAIDLYQRRAHRVGDILTVILNESTSASKSSGANFSKENASTVTDQTAVGRGFLGTGITLNGSLNSSVEFSGDADADQSNQLQGSITVTVSQVLPNGVLEVRGEKWMQLNQGNEYIRISGLVRKEDITPANTLDSTRIADVRIAYSGTGDLAKSNQPGWLSQFFVGELWPF